MRETVKSSPTEQAIIQAFARLDSTALGVAVGTLCSLAVFTATIVLILKGGAVIGPNLALLGQFFIGYTVTVKGAFVGLIYGFVAGFILGWLIGFLRNSLMYGYLRVLKTRAALTSTLDSID